MSQSIMSAVNEIHLSHDVADYAEQSMAISPVPRLLIRLQHLHFWLI